MGTEPPGPPYLGPAVIAKITIGDLMIRQGESHAYEQQHEKQDEHPCSG
jgi:hypothetical protein